MTEDKVPRVTIEDIDGPDPMLGELAGIGVTRKYLARKMKAELNAKRTVFFQKDGVVIERYNVIDWATRQKARMDGNRMYADYPAEKMDHNISQPVVVQIVEQPGCPELPRNGKNGHAAVTE